MHSDRPSFSSPFSNGSVPFPSASSKLTPTGAPLSAAGRKRSRDEAATNLEEDYFAVQEPETEPENEEEWVYGEGMTLIKPNAGYIMEAASQTGTWAEEKAEAAKTPIATPVTDKPILRAAKSQRLDLTATPSIAEEVSSNGALSAPSPERPGYTEPTVDEFTRHLGIGWSSISSDPDIQAAARGWTKFIENHFPINDVRIRLQSRGLSSYLVEAKEGFFLFTEDLKQGQLVSTSLERTWANLSSPVPVFDGPVVMLAVESPKLAAVSIVNAGHSMVNGTTTAPNGVSNEASNVEVEMDMS